MNETDKLRRSYRRIAPDVDTVRRAAATYRQRHTRRLIDRMAWKTWPVYAGIVCAALAMTWWASKPTDVVGSPTIASLSRLTLPAKPSGLLDFELALPSMPIRTTRTNPLTYRPNAGANKTLDHPSSSPEIL